MEIEFKKRPGSSALSRKRRGTDYCLEEMVPCAISAGRKKRAKIIDGLAEKESFSGRKGGNQLGQKDIETQDK